MANIRVHNNPIVEGQEEEAEFEPPGVVNVYALVQGGHLVENAERVQNQPAVRFCDHYWVDYDAVGSDGPIVLPMFHKVFITGYFPMSKKLNHKDKLNNFAVLPTESVSSFLDRFTVFMRSVLNHRIDNESLKEYFYTGQDDNGRAMNDKVSSYVTPVNRDAGNIMTRIEDMMQKMMKRFDATNENVREMRNNLSGVSQKVDAHVVSIRFQLYCIPSTWSRCEFLTIYDPEPRKMANQGVHNNPIGEGQGDGI
uniref:Integrase core domain containing protein n=1 Tax=Solanum tuberosum TaxID=4113 RepID=M1DI47_SOLTU